MDGSGIKILLSAFGHGLDDFGGNFETGPTRVTEDEEGGADDAGFAHEKLVIAGEAFEEDIGSHSGFPAIGGGVATAVHASFRNNGLNVAAPEIIIHILESAKMATADLHVVTGVDSTIFMETDNSAVLLDSCECWFKISPEVRIGVTGAEVADASLFALRG